MLILLVHAISLLQSIHLDPPVRSQRLCGFTRSRLRTSRLGESKALDAGCQAQVVTIDTIVTAPALKNGFDGCDPNMGISPRFSGVSVQFLSFCLGPWAHLGTTTTGQVRLGRVQRAVHVPKAAFWALFGVFFCPNSLLLRCSMLRFCLEFCLIAFFFLLVAASQMFGCMDAT